ncbi:leucyl aminopeptidase [Microcella sp.]|uniref:leucyl aminopeptidase n=1 Tax=Microcella sp. TaxID=1913979 RepID=UPI00391A3CD5
MPLPDVTSTTEPATTIDADALVVFVARTETGPRVLGDASLSELLSPGLGAVAASGAAEETVRLPAPDGIAATSILAVGVGSDTPDAESVRRAAGAALRALKTAPAIALVPPSDDDVAAAVEGAVMGAYRFDAEGLRAREGDEGARTERIRVVSTAPEADAHLARALIAAEAVWTVRDLVTTPPHALYPETFAQRVGELAADLPLEIEVLDEAALAAGGFGGILGVGQGSSRPPRLVVLRYNRHAQAPHLALVGKGITFDSGGLSLKPAASMVGMKYDMTGAATTLAATIAAAKLGLPVRITAWLCLAENMPSATAIRPNDVLTIRGGRTVEVLNTDAEGRLVMADGLVAASEERPDAIVDVATLTGAARVALGERYAGLMGDAELVSAVQRAAEATGELVWPMPLPSELRPLLATDVADIANAKPGNTAAGMLLAGVFLQEFVGRTSDEPDAPRIPWAHLDIAGPANNSGGPFGYTPKGSSGVATRLLIALAEAFGAE